MVIDRFGTVGMPFCQSSFSSLSSRKPVLISWEQPERWMVGVNEK